MKTIKLVALLLVVTFASCSEPNYPYIEEEEFCSEKCGVVVDKLVGSVVVVKNYCSGNLEEFTVSPTWYPYIKINETPICNNEEW